MDVVSSPRLACVEVGGGSTETVLLGGNVPRVLPGARPPAELPLLLAVPGIIDAGRVVSASNLGWQDVDPADALGLRRTAILVLNDAEAAAMGESALRGGTDLTYVGLGTGVGGAVVRNGVVVSTNLFGHGGSFSSLSCACGRTGCLETVAAGWALPEPLGDGDLITLAAAVAGAMSDEPLATPELVVLGGGIARRYPRLVVDVARHLAHLMIEPSAAPAEVKSAAAWGLAHAYQQLQGAVA